MELTDWKCGADFKSQVDIADPLKIDWYFMPQGETEWSEAGRSQNQLYLTYDDPDPSITLYHTLLDIGCRNAHGQTTSSACITTIWSEFTDLVVRRIDGTQMTYWGPYAQDHGVFTTAGLLEHADGRCGAWANMLVDTFRTQGIQSSSFRGIITKDTPRGTGFGFDVRSSIPAQGNEHPHNTFTDGHAVVVVGTTIYDPSYGVQRASLIEWEDAAVDVFRYRDVLGFLFTEPNTLGDEQTRLIIP